MKYIRNSELSLPEEEITPESVYLTRKQFMRAASVAVLSGLTGELLVPNELKAAGPLSYKHSSLSTKEAPTDYVSATHYNNFYEFTTNKEGVAERSRNFTTEGWKLSVSGLVNKPMTLTEKSVLTDFPLEERVYRFRCVEGWSMVIPWVGFSLGELLKRAGVKPGARYVRFETLNDPQRMPGQKRGILDWPYEEGLRMDEAMHPLALMAVGMYGKKLPPQNGAPVRLVVPWKYGFKSIKSIVKIEVTSSMPRTTWNLAAPHEYGFYANVNPNVDHPRWSQATERRIGEFLKRRTELFNGYDSVASLYKGMDLEKYF